MQKLTCEMCGGNDLVKQDGLYVCQHCGTKYSVEEAKRLFKNGTVEIDNSRKLDNLYVLARRAIDEKDFKSAQQYYEEILLEQPEKWEPVFHATYFKTLNNCETEDVIDSVQFMSNKLKTTFVLLENDIEGNQEEKARLIATDVKQLGHKLFEITSNSLYGDNYETPDQDTKKIYIERVRYIYSLLKDLVQFLDRYTESATIKIKFDIKKQGVRLLYILLSDVSGNDKEWVNRRIKEDCSEILAYDHDSDYEYILSSLSHKTESDKIEEKDATSVIDSKPKMKYGCLRILLGLFALLVVFTAFCGTGEKGSVETNKDTKTVASVPTMQVTVPSDDLQKFFMELNFDIKPSNVENLAKQYNLLFKKIGRGGGTTSKGTLNYKIGISEKAIDFSKDARGDNVHIEFDIGKNNSFMKAVYQKEGYYSDVILLKYGYYFELGQRNDTNKEKHGYYYYNADLGSKMNDKKYRPPYEKYDTAKEAFIRMLTYKKRKD